MVEKVEHKNFSGAERRTFNNGRAEVMEIAADLLVASPLVHDGSGQTT
jgi:hypothetical protein